jgi:hypothetical protein
MSPSMSSGRTDLNAACLAGPPYLDVLVGLTENSAVASRCTWMATLPLNLFTESLDGGQ